MTEMAYTSSVGSSTFVVAPFGSWRSPITSDLIAAESIGLSEPHIDRDAVFWLETRPREGGRIVILRQDAQGQTTDIIDPPFSARTRVHEYGGGGYVVGDGIIYFSNFQDQQVYQVGTRTGPQL